MHKIINTHPNNLIIEGEVFSYDELLTITQASVWASSFTSKKVTPSNIAYLIKYGRIPASEKDGVLRIHRLNLEKYYQQNTTSQETIYKQKFGDDINWHLSFENYKEAETTKHVHRLHPYKGKFIPQLVEYFLDEHVDEYKKEVFFKPGDIVLDPFCGSGTTLVQSNELYLHAIGIDISPFNAMISNLKLNRVMLGDLTRGVWDLSKKIESNTLGQRSREFENTLLLELKKFNNKYFPSPLFRNQIKQGIINEKEYISDKIQKILPIYYQLLEKYNINNEMLIDSNSFIDNWYLSSVKSEIQDAKNYIYEISNPLLRDMMSLILSRAVRSSRATTHSDLATLVHPVTEVYYCGKHNKICKPIFSMLGWWKRYAEDTIKRKSQFEKLRTDTNQLCLVGDSREINIFSELENIDSQFANLATTNKIKGIFTSPPYVGMINYHEQHAYAYEMFDLPRNDSSEIGPMSAGRSKAARDNYVEGVSQVLLNCQKYLVQSCDIFIVANDKFSLYPEIAKKSDLSIYNEYKRPVLNRAEGDKGAYFETIFHMKKERYCNV